VNVGVIDVTNEQAQELKSTPAYSPHQRAVRLEPKNRLLATPSGVAPLSSALGFGPPGKLT
jgi:hypothetical protein